MITMTGTEELVLAVVRGQLPLQTLEDAGVRLQADEQKGGQERWITLNVKVPFTIAPKPLDIASGLLTYQHEPEQLRAWAAFVLGASEIIDLAPLDTWAEGDQFLNGLWDASFEGEVKPETLRVAAALVDGCASCPAKRDR